MGSEMRRTITSTEKSERRPITKVGYFPMLECPKEFSRRLAKIVGGLV
jgi:hypothetical protein